MSTVGRTLRLHNRKYKLRSRVGWHDTCFHACKMYARRLGAAAACTVTVADHVGFETISYHIRLSFSVLALDSGVSTVTYITEPPRLASLFLLS
jgi:hypothetical protein